jgi:hypothetical protein
VSTVSHVSKVRPDMISKPRVRRLHAAIALTAATVLLAACSSGATKAAAGSTSVGVARSSAASGSASSPASTSATPTTPKLKAGNPNSSFCGLARQEQAQEEKDASAFATDTPAELEKFEEQAMAELPAFADQAPDEIKASVKLLVAADAAIFAELKKANFDFTKLSTTDLSSLDTPAFTAASQQVTTYLEKTCGITDSASPSS